MQGCFSVIAYIIGVILALVAVAMVIGFWPLALLLAACGLMALANRDRY